MKRWLMKISKKLIPTGGVAERTLKSGIWLSAMNVLDRAFQMLTMIVLARLLDPRAFGLFGIALLSLSAIKQFTDIGLNTALIQQKEDNVDRYLNTTWVLEFARGIVIAGVLVLIAPLLASVFNEPGATGPLRVIALTPLLLGLRNPGIVYFRKNLHYHKEFVYRLSGSIVLPVVAIGYALVHASVWALIFGFVAADAARLLTSYLIHDYRPWPEFRIAYAKELIDYVKLITGSSILTFLSTEGDDAIVGWLLSATSLAFYQMAYRFSNAPATEISQTVSNVTFSMYSQLQEDMQLLRESFFRTVQITMTIAFPMAFGIFAVAPTFVRAFLGSDWLPMVVTMQLFAIYGLIRAFGKLLGAVWKAIGRPDFITKLLVVRITLLAVLIYPATVTYGIEGTALLLVGISCFPMLPLQFYVMVDAIETSYRRLVSELAYPLVASSVMLIAVLFVKESVAIQLAIAEFFLLVGVGAITYLCAVLALELLFGWGIRENIRTIQNAL